MLANAIHDEREKNGPFKDGDDLAARVGLAPTLVSALESHGVIKTNWVLGGESAVMNINAAVPESKIRTDPGVDLASTFAGNS